MTDVPHASKGRQIDFLRGGQRLEREICKKHLTKGIQETSLNYEGMLLRCASVLIVYAVLKTIY